MKKKVMSVVLLSVMAMSLASCSALGGSKVSEKSFQKYIVEELDAEESDCDDVIDAFDDGDFKELKDGVSFDCDDDEFEDFMEAFDMDGAFGEFSKLESSKNYFYLNDKKEKAAYFSLLTFKDEKAASKFLKSTVDSWDEDFCDQADDWAIADEEENELLGKFTMKYDDIEMYIALYQNANSVCLLLSINDDSIIEDFTENFKLDNPVEVLDVEDKDDKDDDDDDDDEDEDEDD